MARWPAVLQISVKQMLILLCTAQLLSLLHTVKAVNMPAEAQQVRRMGRRAVRQELRAAGASGV
jgi:hypothetical protein